MLAFVSFKHVAIYIESDRNIRMTEDFLKNLGGHSALDTSCGKSMAEAVQVYFSINRRVKNIIAFHSCPIIVIYLLSSNI